MKRVSQRGMYNAVADINIVPMLDLVFNLLIIFMLTTPLLEQSIPINLPTARNAAPIKEQDLTTVNLNATGGIFLDRKPVTLAELVDLVIKQTGSKSKVLWGSLEQPPHDSGCQAADMAKTFCVFSWRPKYSLEDGVKKMIEADKSIEPISKI